MRYKLFPPKLLCAALVALCAHTTVLAGTREAQQTQPAQQDEGVVTRGAFLTTRPKTAGKAGKTASGEVAASITTPDRKNDSPNAASNSSASAKKGGAKSIASAKPRKGAGKSVNAGGREAAPDRSGLHFVYTR
jgi:hypothetical protein